MRGIIMSQNWRQSREYRIWVATVKRRDKCCIISGDIKTREAHHIKDASNHPELRYEPDNGVTLARKYHHAYHIRFLKSFKCKCEPETFIRFLKCVAISKDVAVETFLNKIPFIKNIVKK